MRPKSEIYTPKRDDEHPHHSPGWRQTHSGNGNRNKYNISSTNRVTRKFLKVPRCSRTKQRQRNIQKKVCCTYKCVFLLIRPTDSLEGCFRFRRRLLALLDFIVCLSKLYILTRASLLVLAESIYYILFCYTHIRRHRHHGRSSPCQGCEFSFCTSPIMHLICPLKLSFTAINL